MVKCDLKILCRTIFILVTLLLCQVGAQAQQYRIPRFFFDGDFCSLPPVTGLCRAYFPRFYYNPNKKTCLDFVWGGCGGNANNFETFEECMQTCAGRGAALLRNEYWW
ncbi:unnamed protein product [Cyprideis torosa]|uniref:Uncharacterized protein n=1 Tax=Cyprideis torosa TaxID=163714 RepID=A0A7R8W5I5_9CRUS|nr:unnamed protein product [Cyprideis torosa]CAG0884336.1 unnamed protein product [Cyprideis torosa]